jgi:hypothetical protein
MAYNLREASTSWADIWKQGNTWLPRKFEIVLTLGVLKIDSHKGYYNKI